MAPLAGVLPHVGPVRVTREVNVQGLVTGTTIANNVISGSGVGGIRLVGDAGVAGEQQAPVPFTRVYNNTIVGSGGTGFGVFLGQNVSPTLLNNVSPVMPFLGV